MANLQEYINSELARGRAYFSKEDALAFLRQSPEAFQKGVQRLRRKGILIAPRRGFYLIIRPEDRAFGAPDPAKWIGPLMAFIGSDYRISLLRAAAFHGASHQAAMVFQVIAPRQLPKIEIGRHRVEFAYQSAAAFTEVNRSEWLDKLKTGAGYAKVAGIELTLLDSCRYFHRAAGIEGAAQVTYDLGEKANPKILGKVAAHYENSAVRRLGYLLEKFSHLRQAQALKKYASRAKSFKPLDPSVKPILPELADLNERNVAWKLDLNVAPEIDR
ncbi:MAG: type IV toxin-antitoxin system AbiEi family antitoxin [Blastopirellula sp. JB062]